MIDNVLIITGIKLPKKFWNYKRKTKNLKYVLGEIVFVPEFDKKLGEIKRYTAEVENLRLIIDRGNNLNISNSLHKFIWGNNYSDFSYSNLIESILKLQNILGVCLSNAKIGRIEYGVNIEMPPKLIYPTWFSLSRNTYDPMKEQRKIYGRKIACSDYWIKSYDKLFASKKKNEISENDIGKLPNNLTRIEVGAKYSKHLWRTRKIPIQTVSDLMLKDNLSLLGEDLINTYDKIQKIVIPDFIDFKPCEVGTWAAIQNEVTRNHFRVERPESYKNYNRKMKEWTNDYDKNIHTKVRVEIARKWEYLLSN